MKNYLKYIFNPRIRTQCEISYVYSFWNDLQVYGLEYAQKRTFKKHKKEFLKQLSPKQYT